MKQNYSLSLFVSFLSKFYTIGNIFDCEKEFQLQLAHRKHLFDKRSELEHHRILWVTPAYKMFGLCFFFVALTQLIKIQEIIASDIPLLQWCEFNKKEVVFFIPNIVSCRNKFVGAFRSFGFQIFFYNGVLWLLVFSLPLQFNIYLHLSIWHIVTIVTIYWYFYMIQG